MSKYSLRKADPATSTLECRMHHVAEALQSLATATCVGPADGNEGDRILYEKVVEAIISLDKVMDAISDGTV